MIPTTDDLKWALEFAAANTPSFDEITCDHLLVALARIGEGEDRGQDLPVAGRLLGDAGVDADTLVAALVRARSEDTEHPRPKNHLVEQVERVSRGPLTGMEFQKALSAAIDLGQEEAVYFSRQTADSGDLLVGLLAHPERLAARAVAELGLDADTVRGAVERARAQQPEGRSGC